MDREVLDRWCERGILGLVLGILVSMPLAFGGRPQLPAGCWLDFWLVDPFLLAQWLMVPLLVLWLTRIWAAPKTRLLWPPVCWAVLAFVLYAIARHQTADIEYVARQEFIQILVYAFVFFVVVNNLHRQEAMQIIIFTLIAVAMVISFYAFYQFLTGSNRVWYMQKPYPHRGAGTFICPNHLGGFLEMLLPLGLAGALAGRHKPIVKVLLGYASLVILAGIAVTVSRGSWISTILTLGLFFLVLTSHRSHRLPAILFLVVLVGGAVFLVPKSETFQTRAKQLFVHGKLDDDARFSLWRPAWQIWQDQPIWGAGPGHFDYRFRQYRPEEVQARADRAHNDFLNLMADWGLAGLALVASAWTLVGLGVRKTWGVVRNTASDLGERQSSTRFAFVLGSALGLAAIFFHSAVDFNMYIPANALLAVTLMALLTCHLRFASERYWVTARMPLKLLLSAVIIAGVAYLGPQSLRHAAENFWLARAARITDPATPERAEFLQRAFAHEPQNSETAYAIGEVFRILSSDGGEDYAQTATRAMTWFDRAKKLNPWDGRSDLGTGWCLDWLNRGAESGPYFSRGEQLDPNGYYTMDCIGLHYVQLRNYAAARPWFERSLALYWVDNPIARSYLEIVDHNLLTAATNSLLSAFENGGLAQPAAGSAK